MQQLGKSMVIYKLNDGIKLYTIRWEISVVDTFSLPSA